MTQRIFIKIEGRENTDGLPMLVGADCRVLGRVWDVEENRYVTDWIDLPAAHVSVNASPTSIVQAEITVHPREVSNFPGLLEQVELLEDKDDESDDR